MPIEPLLRHVAFISDDAAFNESPSPLPGHGEAALHVPRESGSGPLSAIELARLLALYHDNARKVREARLVIDFSL